MAMRETPFTKRRRGAEKAMRMVLPDFSSSLRLLWTLN